VDPLTAIIVSFCSLGVMLYKRVNLGITLNATALILAFLSLDLWEIPLKIYDTSTDILTISVVLATFGIMWLSQLYKETGVINSLSESLSRIIKNSKIVLSLLPAIIGFLPVAGGALMSAPIVDSEAEKLKLKPEKKAYLNLWFRHTIFPIYPISQTLIITAALTETTVPSIIVRQIPVVAIMMIVGYVISFWKVSSPKSKRKPKNERALNSNFKKFLIAFSPILATIIVAIGLNLAEHGFPEKGFDVLTATFVGLAVLIIISKLSLKILVKPLNGTEIYGITLAAYGAFLLRNIMTAAGISEIFKPFATDGSTQIILLLTVAPAILGIFIGSPQGGIALGISILTGILTFSPKTAALIYISGYLGYVIAPTHLCFIFTANYFRCPLGRVYKYVIPSFLISYAMALLIYLLF
jgi:integral membrane protein (TIGR00529 family)